jgi:hypothetical protein
MSWAVHKYNLGPNSEAISLYWKQGDANGTVSGVTCQNHPGDAEELQKIESIIKEEKMSTSQSDNDVIKKKNTMSLKKKLTVGCTTFTFTLTVSWWKTLRLSNTRNRTHQTSYYRRNHSSLPMNSLVIFEEKIA